MSETNGIGWHEKIGLVLDACIGKMADRLLKTFDAAAKESLTLFKQFCSALNARRQWLKNLGNGKSKPEVKKDNPANGREKKPASTSSGPSLLDMLLQTRPNNSPLRPEDLQSGLIYKR